MTPRSGVSASTPVFREPFDELLPLLRREHLRDGDGCVQQPGRRRLRKRELRGANPLPARYGRPAGGQAPLSGRAGVRDARRAGARCRSRLRSGSRRCDHVVRRSHPRCRAPMPRPSAIARSHARRCERGPCRFHPESVVPSSVSARVHRDGGDRAAGRTESDQHHRHDPPARPRCPLPRPAPMPVSFRGCVFPVIVSPSCRGTGRQSSGFVARR